VVTGVQTCALPIFELELELELAPCIACYINL